MTTLAEQLAATHAETQRPALTAEIEHVRALLEAHRDGDCAPDPPVPADGTALAQLVRDFALSPFERRLVLLAAAVELDGGVAGLVADLQGGDDPRPTFGLALAALTGAHWDAIAPSAPLRRWRLLDLGAGTTLARRPLCLDERVLHHITATPALDERLHGLAAVVSHDAPLAGSQRDVARELAAAVRLAAGPCVVCLDGDDADAHPAVAQELAYTLGLLPVAVCGAALAAPGPELAEQALLIDRELVLTGGLTVLDAHGAGEPSVMALADLLVTPVVVVVGAYGGRLGRRARLLRSVALPSAAEQRGLWADALTAPLDRDMHAAIEGVAQHYRLGAGAVQGLARELLASSPAGRADALRRMCRERSRARLDDLAERLGGGATWDDLVLPDGHLELLRDLARHVRHRTQVYERWGFGERTSTGLGVTALFAGESGTGKTLAAEVVAGALGVDLYRVDLSATVSKYIGETEKNLRRLFDAAEASGAVLLFDEADALFGKRGDVKDGHDRYANLEVAYLLQRMDSYRGLAILTTNLHGNVDRAFLRRLRFIVQFPFPDVAERTAMWQRAFPPATPLDAIDARRLAQLTVSGASIRAIALSAAFAAAHDGGAVTAAHVLRAARLELAKSERALPDWALNGLA